MLKILWNDSLATGVKAIDQEHRALIDLYNSLLDSVLQGRSQSITAGKLERLVQFTVDHFAEEERLMTESGYPELESHRELHLRIQEKVRELASRFEREGTVIDSDALVLLKEWVVDHTLKSDHDYLPWLRKAGLVPAEATDREA